MKYKIAVCDDSVIDREYVISFLRKWAEDKQQNVEIQSFVSSEQFLFQYEEEKDYDILLLDIEMGEMDGVSLAKKIRHGNERIQIVFVTGFPDFIAEGYEVDAVHYLLKPIREEKLRICLDKAVRNLGIKEDVVFLQINNEMEKYTKREISYIEVFAHACTLHTISGDIEVKVSITELEKKLGQGFVRTHRSFLVNMEKIKRITRTDVVLDDGRMVPLARRNYAFVNKAFIAYFGKMQGES